MKSSLASTFHVAVKHMRRQDELLPILSSVLFIYEYLKKKFKLDSHLREYHNPRD